MKQQHQSCSIRQAAHKLKNRRPVEAGPKKLQSWTKVLGHFCISGVFSNSHRPNPSLTHKQRWTRVSRVFFFRVSTLYRVGEGELQENFEKDALFYEGIQK